MHSQKRGELPRPSLGHHQRHAVHTCQPATTPPPFLRLTMPRSTCRRLAMSSASCSERTPAAADPVGSPRCTRGCTPAADIRRPAGSPPARNRHSPAEDSPPRRRTRPHPRPHTAHRGTLPVAQCSPCLRKPRQCMDMPDQWTCETCDRANPYNIRGSYAHPWLHDHGVPAAPTCTQGTLQPTTAPLTRRRIPGSIVLVVAPSLPGIRCRRGIPAIQTSACCVYSIPRAMSSMLHQQTSALQSAATTPLNGRAPFQHEQTVAQRRNSALTAPARIPCGITTPPIADITAFMPPPHAPRTPSFLVGTLPCSSRLSTPSRSDVQVRSAQVPQTQISVALNECPARTRVCAHVMGQVLGQVADRGLEARGRGGCASTA